MALMGSFCVPQSYGLVSGAAWIGLNSIANPGAQQWRWVGGQNYDPTVQARGAVACLEYDVATSGQSL